MQNQFEQLLTELGDQLNSPLSPDENNACVVRFGYNDVAVQIEEDGNSGFLIAGVILGKLPENTFRQKVFKAALSINGSPQSNIKGTMAYGEISNQLYLCDRLNMTYLNGEKLARYLVLFSQHDKIWMQALAKGELPDLHALGMYHLL